jgi:hypothetical protein
MGESSEEFAASVGGGEVSGLRSCQAHDVVVGAEEDRGRTESAMGESSEEFAASSGGGEVNGLRSCEAQNFSSRQEEDGFGITCTLGGVPSGKEEGRVVAWGEPAARSQYALGRL